MFGVAGLPCPWLLPRCTELSRCTLYTTTGEVRTLNLSTERDSGKLGFYVGLNTKTIIGILMITIIIKHQAYFAQSFVLCTLLVVHQLHFQSVHRSCEDIPLVASLWNWKLGLTSSYIKTHVDEWSCTYLDKATCSYPQCPRDQTMIHDPRHYLPRTRMSADSWSPDPPTRLSFSLTPHPAKLLFPCHR